MRALLTADPAVRNNAARILQLFVNREPYESKRWAIEALVEQVASGALDGPKGQASCAARRCDAVHSPIDSICRDLGFMRYAPAVPSLISVLERDATISAAASALGDIGDPQAAPVLLSILRAAKDTDDAVVTALGKLRSRQAVPLLIARLGRPRSTFSGLDVLETRAVLESLRDIGDRSAVPAIRKYLAGKHPAECVATARRILPQLEQKDPSGALVALLARTSDELDRADILSDLAMTGSDRAVAELLKAARTDRSAMIRRSAIESLGRIATRTSLLALCELSGADFSAPMTTDHGWKGPPPDLPGYFRKLVQEWIDRAMHQDFGTDRAACREWVLRNSR